MPNPFEKYLGPEDHFHKKVIDVLRWQYPKVKFHHSPMEGKRSPFERFKMQWLGADAGFPDLIIPAWQLVIELKAGKNKTSLAQDEWLAYFKSIGWETHVCYMLSSVESLFIICAQRYNYFASSPNGTGRENRGTGK